MTADSPMLLSFKRKATVFWLAVSDLKHEWILSACMVLSIMAVLSPLLFLFGLKHGLITIYTRHITENPINREIRPLSSRLYEKEWFQELRKRPDTVFVIPNTRLIAATVRARAKESTGKVELELVPTAEGDPLLADNGTPIPASGECVLTHLAAEKLAVKAGQSITIEANRLTARGKSEIVTTKLQVKGVLPIRASSRRLIFTPLPLLESIERFKDGMAVAKYGWPGKLPRALPRYTGVVVITPRQLDKIRRQHLIVVTGFTRLEEWSLRDLLEKRGVRLEKGNVLFLSTRSSLVDKSSIRNVRNRLRGKRAVLLPYVPALEAHLQVAGKEGAKLSLYGVSPDKSLEELNPKDELPRWGSSGDSGSELLQIALPRGMAQAGEKVVVRVQGGHGILEFPATVVSVPSPFPSGALIPGRLAGILKLLDKREVRSAPDEGAFLLSRKGYSSFRVYAKTIHEVDGLRRFFENQSIPVRSQVQKIASVLQLTGYLDLIYLLIAAVAILGTITAMMASLYASVERKRREWGVLRLIGLSGVALFRFPIYQGGILALGGLLLSIGLFEILSSISDPLFRPYVEQLLGFPITALRNSPRGICTIPAPYYAASFALTLVVSCVASIIAARRVQGVDPAEVLRDE